MKDFQSKIERASKKSSLTKDEVLYGFLMLCATKMNELGKKGIKAESDKFEILVTIKVKEKNDVV